ncbi:MAG: Rieske 2Fe-2S domain-containing protein [Pseudomonadota bacterium]
MSVKYIPVQWNQNKWVYDVVLLAMAGAYLWIFLEWAPDALGHSPAITAQIHNARAFGSCAFLMLTVILCIGPLARLDTRFLPLLYNRRHFGVLTLLVALTHVSYVLDWYYAFSPTPKLEGLLISNTSFDRVIGFPYELFGVFALLVLMVLAFTSHDFWLKFLKPRLWKRLHMLIYPAYAAVVAHVTLGSLQDQTNGVLAGFVLVCAVLVGALHLAAALKERAERVATPGASWVPVCKPSEIRDGYAKVIRLGSGERVAVFRSGETLSAISNACAHQNGPLGEGRILDGCVTCPWHGFQYRVSDGCSPAPFTEKVPTYNIRLSGDMIEVDAVSNKPGTAVPPTPIPESLR